jgi:hypothetical protein
VIRFVTTHVLVDTFCLLPDLSLAALLALALDAALSGRTRD